MMSFSHWGMFRLPFAVTPDLSQPWWLWDFNPYEATDQRCDCCGVRLAVCNGAHGHKLGCDVVTEHLISRRSSEGQKIKRSVGA